MFTRILYGGNRSCENCYFFGLDAGGIIPLIRQPLIARNVRPRVQLHLSGQRSRRSKSFSPWKFKLARQSAVSLLLDKLCTVSTQHVHIPDTLIDKITASYRTRIKGNIKQLHTMLLFCNGFT